MPSLKFHLITPVWGEAYVDEFLTLCVPTLLAEGNLGCFQRRACGDKYKIYTRAKDAESIRAADVYRDLCACIATEIHLVDDIIDAIQGPKNTKYDHLNLCQSRGINAALDEQAAFILLLPDQVFSEGSLESLVRLTEQGKRLILIGGYRVATETFVPDLRRFIRGDNNRISISGRELSKLFVKHQHPEMGFLYPEGVSKSIKHEPNRRFWHEPNRLFWEVEGEGLLIRGFHLTPVAFNPSPQNARRYLPQAGVNEAAIDGGDYMMKMFPDFEDIYVVADSDEVASVSVESLSEPSRPNRIGVFNPLRAAVWVGNHCCSYHERFIETKVKFHWKDLSPKWEEVGKRSDRVIGAIRPFTEFFRASPESLELVSDLTAKFDKLTEAYQHLQIDDVLTHIKLGGELHAHGKLKEAIKTFGQAVRLAPSYAPAYNLLGKACYENRDFDSAEKAFLGAIKVAPKDVDGLLTLARFYDSLNRTSEAIDLLIRAVTLSPTAEVMAMLGRRADRPKVAARQSNTGSSIFA